MIDIPESYEGIYAQRSEAEARALELQAQGRKTRIEKSLFWFQWVVFATAVE